MFNNYKIRLLTFYTSVCVKQINYNSLRKFGVIKLIVIKINSD